MYKRKQYNKKNQTKWVVKVPKVNIINSLPIEILFGMILEPIAKDCLYVCKEWCR